MKDFICKKCGNTTYIVQEKSNGTGIATGLYCAKCGTWHKWLNKQEKILYSTHSKEIDKDKEIARLTAENDKLRVRLQNAVELPCKVGDTVWCIRAYGKGYQIEQNSVMEIVFDGNNMRIKTSRGLFGYDKWTYGLDCFTDRTKAEAKLKEVGGGENE